MRPMISVITPVFNRESTILRSVTSVLNQNFDDFELIVVDDCSTDRTCDVLRQIEDPRLRIVQFPEWRGANHARNTGLSIAAGELVTFLDSDDEYLPFRLRSTVEALEENREFNVMISSFETIRGKKRTTSTNRDMRLGSKAFERQLFAQTLFIAGSAITVRRQTALDANGFDGDLRRLQDRDFLLRLARNQRALISSKIDWKKHQCTDSISSQKHGYIDSYADLAGKHPRLLIEYGSLARYMAARHLLSCLTKGRLDIAIEDNLQCRRRAELGYGLFDLLSGYREGKKQRKEIRSEQLEYASSPRNAAIYRLAQQPA